MPRTKARKRQSVGQEIIQGLKEVLHEARAGKRVPGTRTHVVPVPDVKAIRRKLGYSQTQFASRFGINLRTLQDWEQGRTRPDQVTSTFLKVIERSPMTVQRVVASS